MRWLLLAFLSVWLVLPAWAAEQNDSFQILSRSKDYVEAQMIRCNNAATIENPTNGEVCADEDHTQHLDCRGMRTLSVRYYNYEATASQVIIWTCEAPIGFKNDVFDGTDSPDDTDASATNVSPLCVDLTLSQSVTLDGEAAGTRLMSIDGIALGFIIGELSICTAGACDSTLIVSCAR